MMSPIRSSRINPQIDSLDPKLVPKLYSIRPRLRRRLQWREKWAWKTALDRGDTPHIIW